MEPEISSQPIIPTDQQPPVQSPTLEKQKSPVILWLFILALIGVTSYFGYQNWQLKNQLATQKQQPAVLTPSPTPIPFPTISLQVNSATGNTTYTNQKYGFSFEYPQNIFVYHSEQPYAFYAANKKDGGSPVELGSDGLWLNVSFESGGPVMDAFYKQIMDLPSGGKLEQNAVTKISNLNTDGVVGVSFYQGLPKTFVGEPAYAYEAVWLHDGRTYRLFLAAQQYTVLMQNESIFKQILSTFRFTQKAPLTSGCKSTNLNIGLTPPNNIWQCKVNNLGKEEAGWDGAISLTSPLFTVEISSLGRGPYCGDGPDPENLCQETLFYKNDKFGLTTFTYKGEDKELFGGFLIGRKPWISVKYTNMETQKLTDSQKQELFQLLNSASEIN